MENDKEYREKEKIKRAVKEALDDKAIEDLGKQLTALSTQMAEGFTAVHTRQDIANGRTRKLEDWKLKVNTQTALVATLVSTLMGFLIFLANKYL